MDEEAVPAILAYRGGEIFANMVAVLDEMPAGQDLSEDNLEALLKRYVHGSSLDYLLVHTCECLLTAFWSYRRSVL